jgi:hypothetical protein
LTAEVDRVSYGTQQILQGMAGLMVLVAYLVVAAVGFSFFLQEPPSVTNRPETPPMDSLL